MGVLSFTVEFTTLVDPAEFFRAFVLDSHNLVPKVMPESVKSVHFVEGDGGVGSIKQTNYVCGDQVKYLKHRIDAIDEEALACKYSLIEGDVLVDKLEFIAFDVKFGASDNGGCACKITSEYHFKDGVNVNIERIKNGTEDKATELFKVIEKYLLENPPGHA
ncbi:major allergen Pru ar 1-like [Quillaja saponaria]|uniref:Major allergen Pru ar 1-like n=1 Tax=Quillaja saponaria TaxID=32244 RepID=A0AAD7VLY0_QUISA|nr:major allergen Pru ar 1-like [Quillaja saponaria]